MSTSQRTPWIVEASDPDGVNILPIESGVVRIQTVLGAERMPGMIGVGALAMMGFSALSGQWNTLYGVIIWAIWHGIAVLMYRRDPQYWAIMWRKEWQYRLPSVLYPAPGVIAPRVPVEASVPVRGEAGLYGE